MCAGLTIRNATPDDTDTLFEIRCGVVENHQSRAALARVGVTPDSVAEMIAGGQYVALLAELDRAAVGFTMAHIPEGYVFACFVREGFAARGIGKQLMLATEAGLAQAGVESAWLSTGPGESLRAVGFYTHLGWRRAGFLPDGQIKFIKQLA